MAECIRLDRDCAAKTDEISLIDKLAIDLASGSNPDAVFIDRSLPDTSGDAVCRLLLEKECVARSAPVMLMTAGVASSTSRCRSCCSACWRWPPRCRRIG